MNDSELSQAQDLVNLAIQALRTAGFKVEGVVSRGEARAGIIDSAEEWRADLIVLGSHGRTGLQRFLFGSVSEAVIRHAQCSVEVVRSLKTKDRES